MDTNLNILLKKINRNLNSHNKYIQPSVFYKAHNIIMNEKYNIEGGDATYNQETEGGSQYTDDIEPGLTDYEKRNVTYNIVRTLSKF